MKKLILSVAFVMLSCGPMRTGKLIAQTTGANVVVLQGPQDGLAKGTFTTTRNLTSGVLQNIGQTNHYVKLEFSTVSGTWTFSGAMQGSIDGTTYFNIGPVVITTSNFTTAYSVTLIGYANLPWLRVQGTLTNLMAGSVTVNETYVGTNSAFSNVDQYGANIGMISKEQALVYSGLVPVVPFNVLGNTVVVYGLSIYAPTTFTSLFLTCSPDGTNPSRAIGFFENSENMVPFQTVWANSLRTYGACSVGEGLYYAAVGAGTGHLNIQYRLE